MDFVRPKRPSVGIDMAPLIDCVFLLLIFFMLSSSFMQPAIPLQLPESTSSIPSDSLLVTISVDEHDAIYLNQQQVTLATLTQALFDVTDGDTEKTIVFRGDRSIRYDVFMNIVTAVRTAGFLKLSLQHDSATTVTP